MTDTLVYLELKKLNEQVAKMTKAFELIAKEARISNEKLSQLVANMESK